MSNSIEVARTSAYILSSPKAKEEGCGVGTLPEGDQEKCSEPGQGCCADLRRRLPCSSECLVILRHPILPGTERETPHKWRFLL